MVWDREADGSQVQLIASLTNDNGLCLLYKYSGQFWQEECIQGRRGGREVSFSLIYSVKHTLCLSIFTKSTKFKPCCLANVEAPIKNHDTLFNYLVLITYNLQVLGVLGETDSVMVYQQCFQVISVYLIHSKMSNERMLCGSVLRHSPFCLSLWMNE